MNKISKADKNGAINHSAQDFGKEFEISPPARFVGYKKPPFTFQSL